MNAHLPQWPSLLSPHDQIAPAGGEVRALQSKLNQLQNVELLNKLNTPYYIGFMSGVGVFKWHTQLGKPSRVNVIEIAISTLFPAERKNESIQIEQRFNIFSHRFGTSIFLHKRISSLSPVLYIVI